MRVAIQSVCVPKILAYVQTNLKMYNLWGLRWFLRQLLPVKVSTWRKKWKRPDNYAVLKKKDTATILSFERRHWISVGPIGLVPRWFNGSAQNSLLWPCLFFLTPHNYRDAFTFSAMCWLWPVITGAKITVALLNYTFSDSSGRKHILAIFQECPVHLVITTHKHIFLAANFSSRIREVPS